MKEERKTVCLDASEEGAVIEGLNKIRTEQLDKNGDADFVSDLMLKIIRTPSRKGRARDEAR
ncbi:MAG: hypothetical protein LBH95_01365 [Oscillospiraceae bacterium]|nr:hypothetical protein [Oscillospiraceae bacterium]